MQFTVYWNGVKKAAFRDGDDAQRFAQWLSEMDRRVVEVNYTSRRGGGIVGQYKNGHPTPEFAGRSDAWFPAGPKVGA